MANVKPLKRNDDGRIAEMTAGDLIDSGLVPEVGSANVILSDVDCDSSVFVGAVVYMNISGVAFNAVADSTATSNIIGIAVSKDGATKCNIRVTGVTGELFSSLDPTKEYFLSDVSPGYITTTIPTDSGHVVLRVGQPFSDKKLLVNKGTGMVRE